MLIDVAVTSVGLQEVNVRIVSYIGSGYERDNAPSSTYAANDYRKFGMGGSGLTAACVCASQPAPAVRCLDKEIEYRINTANIPTPGISFMNVETWTIGLAATNLALKRYKFDDPFLQNPNDPGYDGCFETLTYSWWSFYVCDNTCVAPPNASFWTTSTWSAVMKIRQFNCPSKNFKVSTMGSDWYVTPGLLEPTWLHTSSFAYGNPVIK